MSLFRGRRGSPGGDSNRDPSSTCGNCWRSWAASISSSLRHADSVDSLSGSRIGSSGESLSKKGLLRSARHRLLKFTS